MVREVKGIEKMSMLGAGRGARERGGRRLEVEVNSKRRGPRHDVPNLVLETVEESCAFGEDIVLIEDGASRALIRVWVDFGSRGCEG